MYMQIIKSIKIENVEITNIEFSCYNNTQNDACSLSFNFNSIFQINDKLNLDGNPLISINNIINF